MLNLRSVDLNLLPVFEAAYEERSLSRAAVRLAMTQPAVSHALARLRSTFREELFIRHSRGMTPTPFADAVYARLGGALGLVRSAVGEGRVFDPPTSTRHFDVCIPHPLGPMVALRLIEALKAAAPGITLRFDTQSRPADLVASLLNGRYDLAVDWLPAKHAQLVETELFQDHMTFVVRDGHPILRSRDRKAAIAEWGVVRLRPRMEWATHPLAALRAESPWDANVVLEVSEFLEIFLVVSQSDLIGLAPASTVSMASGPLDLKPIAAGPEKRAVPVNMAWRSAREHDPAHRFLRDHLRKAAAKAVKG